ncbi:MAG: DUF1573 domain-containing protein [Planctomycetaceae bacterium]
MRAVVVVIGLAALVAMGFYAIDLAQRWRTAGVPSASEVPAMLGREKGDPHAPPRLDYWPAPAAPGAEPQLVVEPSELDFGRVAVGGQRERRVEIANTGAGPLEVSQGTTTCEATLSDSPGETLAPGERRTLVVRWSPTSATEGEDQFLEMRTNDPAQPRFRLTLKGRGAVPLAIVPNSIWELPVVEGQEHVERTGWLTSNLVSALEVSDLDFDRELLDITTRPAPPQRLTELEALSGVELVISLKASKVYGLLRIPLRVRVRVPGEAQDGIRETTGDASTTTGPTGVPTATAESSPEAAGPPDPEETPAADPHDISISDAHAARLEDEEHPEFPEVILLVTVLRKGPLLLVGQGYDAKQGIAGFGAFSASDGAELPLTLRVRNPPGDGLRILGCESDPPGLTATLTPSGDSQDEANRFKLRLVYPPGSPAVQRLVSNPGFVRLRFNHPEVTELVLPIHLQAH